MGEVQLESTERQRKLEQVESCLSDEKERYERLASNTTENSALVEAEQKIELLRSDLLNSQQRLDQEVAKNSELAR